MAAKIEPTEGQSASAAADYSDDNLTQQLRAIVEAHRNPLEVDEPVERDDLRTSTMPYLDHEASERKAIYDRLVAIENEMKKRRPRRFRRYLVAILLGVAATLAWQSYGESAKQIIATRAPELGWSPEAKQMIATSIQWIGWTKPPAGPEKQAPSVAQTAPTTASLDRGQVQQMTQNLATLRQTVEQLAAGQDQMAREIARSEAAVAELIAKIPEPPTQPSVAPARKPTPVPPSSRTPIPPRQ
jgi:cell division protein FtsB